jgi:hypothetical protein
MSDTEDPSKLISGAGTYEEALDWIGKTGSVQYASEPVNKSMIQLFAAMLEDGNPLYWNERLPIPEVGKLCAPPGLLMVLQMSPIWSPGGTKDSSHFRHKVPLPKEKDTLLLVNSDTTFYRQLYEGDEINYFETIDNITEEKQTGIGNGHFVTATTTINNQSGETIADRTVTEYRYSPHSEEESPSDETSLIEGRRVVTLDENGSDPKNRYASKDLGEIKLGNEVDTLEFPVTYNKVIQSVAATRDFYPAHSDPEFARAQGNETIFLNTPALEGLIDRFVLDWAGPNWRVKNRTIQIQGSAIAGEAVNVKGKVESLLTDGDTPSVEIQCGIYQNGEIVVDSKITITEQWDICPKDSNI